MPNVRVYRVLASRVLLGLAVWMAVYVVLVGLRRLSPVGQIAAFVSLGFYFFCWLIIKVPRLEITDEGLRFVGLGYDLYTPWSGVERLDTWNAGLWIWKTRGLVSSNLAFDLAWWAKPFYPLGGFLRRFSTVSTAPVTTGIPIEPLFAKTLSESELGDELRRYVPRIFDDSQVEGAAP